MSWMGVLKVLVTLGGASMICVMVICTLMYFEKWLDEKPWHLNKRKER